MATESEKEPEAKRLRSCEPDLIVIVGAAENEESKKEYRYHSQVMASHSHYIDTMLATPMKESESLTINFPDLTPELWEDMVKYLDPSESLTLSIQTAMKLAPAYDKYSFTSGLKVCDHVLSAMFAKNREKWRDEKPFHDLNLLIDAILVAHEAHLERTMKLAVAYFQNALRSVWRYGRIMFDKEQIKKLVPLIVEKKLLQERSSWSEDQINNPMFPEYFVLCCHSWEKSRQIERAVVGLLLSGSGCKADGEFESEGMLGLGVFKCDRWVKWGGTRCAIFIGCLRDDWVIYGETKPELDEDGEPDYDSIDTKILWRNPYSWNLPLPPKTGWEPEDELAHGNPEIEYIYPENAE